MQREVIEEAMKRIIANAERQVYADVSEHTPERDARVMKLANEGIAVLTSNLRDAGYDANFQIQAVR